MNEVTSDEAEVAAAVDGTSGSALRQRSRSDTGTLGKAISVLDIVASADRPLRFTDILDQCDQPRGTLHRQLSNLLEEGLLTLNRDHSYSLGLRLLQFAAKSWAGSQFRAIAEPHLKTLHEKTGETVHLGVLRGVEVIYLDKVESLQAVRMYSQIGNASPAFCTGVGKAAMSAMTDAALDKILGDLTFRRFTEHTIVTPQDLKAELQNVRSTGNSYDREEHEIGIRCVAAPVYSHDRNFVAGISVTGPAYRVSMQSLQSWAGIVSEAARAIMDDMASRLGPRT